MGISDRIEAFIVELMKEEDGWLSLQRNELASIFNCVPSQINYVISTRFNRDRGYIVESRRGGGGYLRIRRIEDDGRAEIINSIGNEISSERAQAYVSRLVMSGNINEAAARLILSAVSDKALLRAENTDEVRADIMKMMLSEI